MTTKQIAASVMFDNNRIDLTDEELCKVRQYQLWSSGVKFYDKNDKPIDNPFDEFPQTYTIDLTKDYHSLLYDLSSEYYLEFPEPDRQELVERLMKEQHTVKYVFDNIPWSSSGIRYPGSFHYEEPD